MEQGETTNANRVVFHLLAPSGPKPSYQRLPPMLRSFQPASVPSYSKGAWGLSVLLRVDGIFTATSISPSLRLRQRPSRYAVHARRNLPDKELRYLRTVIVTAAVYRCFGCQLWGEPLTDFLNIPAPSRRHSVYILLRVSTELCF
jgi:hypothetical protein